MKKFKPIGIGIFILISGVGLGFLIAKFSAGALLVPPTKIPKPAVNNGSEYANRQPVSVDLTSLYPKEIFRFGNPNIKTLALTFDDGPDSQFTPKILDVLKKYNVKATFFVVGSQIEKYPEIFKRIIREGHAIGSHSYQHLNICRLSAAKIKFQLNKNQELIQNNGGSALVYYRPPYGALDPTSIELISKNGYKIVLWTIDSLDWRGFKKQQVLANVVPKLKNGYIILQHCGTQTQKESLNGTVEALPGIIESAQRLGCRFTTIPELLKKS
ncbi:MAG TPA: polysaccharide deacetylase family protein [Bacillota bacterium]|nr:polysaccharide deacetylase family protein [Bacillota bacterium]